MDLSATSPLRFEEARLRGIDDQKRWEAIAAERGMRRYHAICQDQTLDQTPPGLSVMRDAMPGIVAKIAEAQAEALAGIAEGGAGRQPDWWWVITNLPADQLALITLRCVLAGMGKNELFRARRVTSGAFQVADAVRLQLDYELWVKGEREKMKADRRAGRDTDDLIAALKSRVKVIDTQAVRRWWKKIGKVRDEPWSAPQKLSVGTKLIACLVEGGGSWFEIAVQPAPGGKTECRILLSEMAVKAMEDLDQRASLAQPLRLPMICPPKRWAYQPRPQSNTQKEAA